MGVPKFYRWISERYPCLSEVIKEYQIPQFDNLYLDMNGIIHVCSHPNDDDPHFRITEEKIFADICHYLDFLFKMIKPQKVFFMAVDGVAPRAKMNQQRGRRFRTARDALMLEQKARDGGESLPTEARFDSNCITPGTAFMVRLHDVLKNFVVYKLSTDKLWQNVKVYLSGHETPGEGEHKIMDFIRYEKSQKNYDPNTRHCLYGLDADLIMLGLCSHEPHFSLLREEVRFGKKANQKRIMTPEETTFHLLHLSLLREYLEYEFMPAKSKIDFEFDIEKIIDDFVLMSFLVGNDFIPHLPQLHIHHDALPTLFQSYIDALPTLGGYINEDGFLNLERFEKFFKKLAEFDYMKFGEVSEFAPPGSKTKSEIYDEDTTDSCLEKLTNLGFSEETLSKTTEFDSGSDDENDDSLFTLEFEQHKRDYYRNKLEFENVTANDLREQAEGYVRAIQWNLHYYYNGVPSWGWYYPHHYAPYISDVKDFKNMSLNFELGEPFLPFQQLLSVLPSLSKELLPMTYQILMTDESSPLISFYPPDFETDLNGKKQDWEAVVLIPFIKEDLLLKHAAEADKSLTPDERQRNRHGPHLLYTYSKKATRGLTPSFLPAFFPPLESHHSKCQELDKNFFRLSPEQIKKGLCDGAHLDVHFTGFPTLKHIKHTAHLSNEDVKVFQMISQRDNMILTVTDIVEPDLKKAADSMLGKIIHVGWPHLVKGCVEMVADAEETYSLENDTVVKSPTVTDIWKSMVDSVKEHHTKRLGIILGDVGILVHAKSLTGSKLLWDEKIMEEIQWTERCSQFPYKTIVKDLEDHSPERKIQKNCKDLYPIGSSVFMLGSPYYGCMGTVSDNDVIKNRGTIIVKFEIPDEPDMKSVIKNKKKLASLNYMPGYILAQHLAISGYFLSRLTGTLLIQTNSKESIGPNKVNVGLNLKFNKKNEEVVGYSKKTEDNQWLYSDQVFETLEKYLSQFPEFFEKLVPLAKGDIVYLEDLYPNGEGREVIKEVTNWLKCQQYYSAERQVCGLNTLDEGIVAAIEDVVNSATATRKVTSKNIFVKPQDLYNPYLCKGCVIPDSKANYQLFDRVINVSHTLTVPLGRRGTIIGIRTADKLCDYVYEVVFDQDFFGGIKIHCSPGRGYRMPPSALINISYGDRLYGKPRSPRKRINIDQVTNILGSHLSSNSTLPNTNVSQFARNTLFSNDSTAFGSPQVQILRKEGPQSPFNSPVSENDSVASPQIINHSPLSGFVTQGAKYNDWFERFTIPNINQTRNSTGSSKTMPANDKEYDAVWDGMLNKMSEKSSPAKHPIEKDSKPHGKSVTVQELFNAFENQVEPKIMADGAHAPSQPSPVLQQPSAPSQPPLTQQQFSTTSQLLPTQQQPSAPVAQPKQVATMELLSLCINLFGQPPTYSYNQLHFNHWHIATVALPDGRMIASVQCPNRIDATENAAEKALIILRGHVPPQFKQKPPLMSKPPEIGNFRHAYQPQVPYFQNVHSEYRMPFPSIIPNAPPPVYSSNGPSIRYPTVRVPLIPESFVKQNQMILAGHVPKAESMHIVPSRTIPILPSQDSMKLKDNEHYVLKSKESVFVPLQVSRNSTKKPPPPPETSLNLLDTEWPSLSASEKKAPSLDPCLTPLSFTNSSTVETKSLIKSPKEIILGKSSTAVTEERHVVVTRAPSTTPKPRKPRIAANIPNLS